MTRRPRARGALRRPRRSVRPRRAGPVPRFLAAVLLLVGFAALASAGLALAPGPAARAGQATRVMLAPKTRLTSMAGSRAEAGVIRWPLTFVGMAVATGSAHKLKAGEYSFPSGASLFQVLYQIRTGDVVRHFVTIPEGLTSAQAAAILDRASELTGPTPIAAEGSLLPETYQVTFGESRAHVIERMQTAMSALLQALWASRSPDLPYRAPGDAVTLASIVEKETALPSERPHVAAVYLNRLRAGMRLDSDPTVVYGLTGGAVLGHGLRVSELARRTPYNTYVTAGLPPTPIANPGRAALQAALNPSRSDDLYFVADGTGGHVFSSSLATHLKNVAHWRSIERSQSSAASGGG